MDYLLPKFDHLNETHWALYKIPIILEVHKAKDLHISENEKRKKEKKRERESFTLHEHGVDDMQ